QAEGDLRTNRKGGDNVIWKTETGVMQPHIKKEAFFKEPHINENTFSPETSGGNMALPTPSFWSRDTDFGLLASRTLWSISSICLNTMLRNILKSNLGCREMKFVTR
ncbi:unnamed protein product, partial [Rangifer tarandus platyrhynchus]